ncbi:helix-turn-helix domain-containing protein [Streptomyces sp. CC224B]|uniref:helix-turn-helix domain-containing protein n=1 Tax=Streptomyces sp. CC224B TaxID=3044571 RepID=UPI0024A838CC|nr:helix-turn-helix domain-containing protein [Streptomyces sp. CC224B]
MNFLKNADRKKHGLVIHRGPPREWVTGPDMRGGATGHAGEEEDTVLRPVAATAVREPAGSAVARTLAVLRALRELGPGAHPLAVVAARAELPAPTAHRYVRALVREGAAEQCGPRGHYALTETSHRSTHLVDEVRDTGVGQTSPALRAELVTLQSRTGQVSLLYAPLLVGAALRFCIDRAVGAHAAELAAAPRTALRRVWSAPLDEDPAGLAMLACLDGVPPPGVALDRVREQGHAVGPSPLPGWESVAAPVWRGSVLAGAVALLAPRERLRGAAARTRCVHAVMDTAAAMSGLLTRTRVRRVG